MKKQSEAVFNAICEVTGQTEFDTAVTLTTDQRKEVCSIIVEGFNTGDIALSETAKTKYSEGKKLSSYVSGLVSNWMRKAPALNGGIAYTPKNPGSRTGQGDPQIKELRKLLSLHKDTDNEAKIQSHIDARVAEIKASKVKDVVIDTDNLPEELRGLVA